MKKIKFLVFILSIFGFINVYADSHATLSLECPKKSFTIDEKLSCDVILNYQEVEVKSVELTYSSSLILSFSESDDVITKENNVLTFNFNNVLPNNEENTKLKIATLEISANSDILYDKYSVNFNNIRLNTNSESLSLEDYKDDISYDAKKSSDATLKSISIDHVLLEDFKPDKYNYDNLKSSNIVVWIDAEANDAKASVMGLGSNILKENVSRAITITVIAEDKTQKVYTLNITYVKEAKKSSDNTLTNLEIYNGNNKINFTFDKNKTTYDVNVASSVEKVNIKANLSDSKSTFVTKYGPRDISLKEGKNEIQVKVKAENEEVKTYTLNINRDKTDNFLSSLIINNVKVLLENNKLDYEITLPNSEEKTNVSLKASDNKSKVAYEDIPLEVGENILSIKVTLNNKTNEYKIKIIREEMEEEPEVIGTLEKIIIAGYDFPFDKNVFEYDLNVSENTNSLNISITPNDNIDFSVFNNGRLSNNSKVTIRIKDSEGIKNYYINIHKPNTKLTNIICYSVFIIGLLIFITSIVYAKKRK